MAFVELNNAPPVLTLLPCAVSVQVVRGSPSDVLDVLMHGSVNTTILGPARTVEVLQCVKDDKTTKEVLRIEVEAPGWAGTLCAPREVLLERVLKMDDVSVIHEQASARDGQRVCAMHSNCC
eukprot:1159839-Pelagomonas_calceolata.AAC.18